MRRTVVALLVLAGLTLAGSALAEPRGAPAPMGKRRHLVGAYCPLFKTFTFREGTTVPLPSIDAPFLGSPPPPKLGDWPAVPPAATLEPR
jgi:hypothetical protein